jgi:hypothetical protein
MTRTEYAEYKVAVDRGLEGLSHVSSGACSGCEKCRDDYGYDDEAETFESEPEPYFSKASCDACGSKLAGNRHPLHGVGSDNKILHLDVCMDCVYYVEYDRLDDATMDSLEADLSGGVSAYLDSLPY